MALFRCGGGETFDVIAKTTPIGGFRSSGSKTFNVLKGQTVIIVCRDTRSEMGYSITGISFTNSKTTDDTTDPLTLNFYTASTDTSVTVACQNTFNVEVIIVG